MSCSSRKPGKQPLGPDALTEEKELLKLLRSAKSLRSESFANESTAAPASGLRLAWPENSHGLRTYCSLSFIFVILDKGPSWGWNHVIAAIDCSVRARPRVILVTNRRTLAAT